LELDHLIAKMQYGIAFALLVISCNFPGRKKSKDYSPEIEEIDRLPFSGTAGVFFVDTFL